MSRTTALLLLLFLGVIQLVWLFRVWRKDGFLATLKLFIYGVVSAVITALQYEMDL